MIQELKLTHRHHMARPSPGIPLQIKICLHSFVFFCDDIGSLTFNRGRNTKWRGANTNTMTAEEKYRMHESLVVTLSVVLHFSFISPSLCIVMWGPSEPGRTQAMVHGAPWSELCRVPGLAQSWQRREWRHSDVMDHMSREILTTQWDLVTRSEENRAESSDILTIRGSPPLKWEICSCPGICLQVDSLGVITVRRANIKNQHLLDLLLICEIVAWSCYNCGQIWRDSSWCGGTLCLIIHPAHTVERHGSQSGQVPVCSQARISPVLGGFWQENWLSDSNFVKLRHLATGDWGGMASWGCLSWVWEWSDWKQSEEWQEIVRIIRLFSLWWPHSPRHSWIWVWAKSGHAPLCHVTRVQYHETCQEMETVQGQARPHKTLKCAILEPGPGWGQHCKAWSW